VFFEIGGGGPLRSGFPGIPGNSGEFRGFRGVFGGFGGFWGIPGFRGISGRNLPESGIRGTRGLRILRLGRRGLWGVWDGPRFPGNRGVSGDFGQNPQILGCGICNPCPVLGGFRGAAALLINVFFGQVLVCFLCAARCVFRCVLVCFLGVAGCVVFGEKWGFRGFWGFRGVLRIFGYSSNFKIYSIF